MFIQREYKNINETKVNKRQGGTTCFWWLCSEGIGIVYLCYLF